MEKEGSVEDAKAESKRPRAPPATDKIANKKKGAKERIEDLLLKVYQESDPLDALVKVSHFKGKNEKRSSRSGPLNI